MRESGYSSSHSSDKIRRHERRTADRDRSPLYSNLRSVRTNALSLLVRLGSLALIILLVAEVTRYGRVVKPVHREGTIYY